MTTSTSVLQLTQKLTFASLFALGLACGAAPDEPIGETQQPIRQDGADEPNPAACAGGIAPVEAAAGECTITARALCFSSREAACACAGCDLDECAFAESFPEQAVCPPSGGGSADPNSPVSDDPDAPVSSDPGDGVSGSPGGGRQPGQPGGGSSGNVGCNTPAQDPGAPGACEDGHPADAQGRCDFVVGDACFDSADSACACAGCEPDQCVVLESYPAQIRCL
jgi:hypothetical protein